jgi:hypothetical protein
MRSILTSRNFWFLTPVNTTPPEGIAVEPDTLLKGEHTPPCEGGLEGDTCSGTQQPKNSQKRKANMSIDPREPQKT